MPMAPQSLYTQLWERGGKQMSLEFSRMFADTVKTSLLTADRSKFLPQRRGTLGHRSWKAVSVVQPVPRSMMNAGVVDQEVQRQAVERQVGRRQSMDTLVHQHGEFVRYSLRRTKPMQTVKQRSDVVV